VQSELVNVFVEARAYGANFDPAWEDDGPIGFCKRPLVVESTFHGYQPMQMDFVQAFIFFWNAFWDSETLRRLDLEHCMILGAGRVSVRTFASRRTYIICGVSSPL
jgi:hypothetical protein